MIVCVETNFVLEVDLGQEQAAAAETILDSAESGEVELAIPSFSIAEPFATVTKRHRDRRHLANYLNAQTHDLKRSAFHQDDVTALEPLAGALVQIGRREMDRLVNTIERLLAVATVIQIDLLTFQSAMKYRLDHDLSEQDAIIYAAVVRHLAANARTRPHFFVSKNWRDYNIPGIEQELRQLHCTFLASFNSVGDMLRHHPQPIE